MRLRNTLQTFVAAALVAAPLQAGSWRHHALHLDQTAEFAAGEFVRAELASATGVRLAPTPQPPNVEDDGSASYTSPELVAGFPFRDLAVSCNVDTPSGAGFWLELRVAPEAGEWSDWLRVCEWGENLPGWEPTDFGDLQWVDERGLHSSTELARAQFRLIAWLGAASGSADFRVQCVDLCFSNPLLEAEAPTRDAPRPAVSTWQRSLGVAFQSQHKAGGERLGARFCAPTALSMALAALGKNHTPAKLANRLYDARRDRYGTDARAVQQAFEAGVASRVERFAAWGQVERAVADGQVLVLDVEPPRGAPEGERAWWVLDGFDSARRVLVFDPSAESADTGRRVLERAEVERRWLARGGAAWVLSRSGRR